MSLFPASSTTRRATGLLVLAALLACACSSGCVRRRLTIRSNPPGAMVYIDKQEIGTTPVSAAFIYYGTREIKLVKDGFETLVVKQKFSSPWYQVPPLDFFSDNLSVRELRDERELDFQLVQQRVVPRAELMQRAEGLRLSSQQGYAAPLAPVGGATLGTPLPIVPPETVGPPGIVLPPSGPRLPPPFLPPGR